MSKKQNQSTRLSSLFTNLGEQTPPSDPQAGVVQVGIPALPLAGWTWELDGEGNYAACSPEVANGLGLPPGDLIGRPMRTYRLNPQSVSCLGNTLDSPTFPAETVVNLRHNRGHWIPVRIHVLSGPASGSSERNWRGFSQVLPPGEAACADPIPPEETNSTPENGSSQPAATAAAAPRKQTGPLPPHPESLVHSIAIDAFGKRPIDSAPSLDNPMATLAVPIQAGQLGEMRLEIIDDLEDRAWTEDEQQMVNDVANQLALALDNARLYMAAQQELAERMRAEEIVLHRNQDLATLNQMGQRLSSLTSRSEVLNTLTEMIGQVLDNRNLTICLFDRRTRMLSFPIHRKEGVSLTLSERQLSNELADFMIQHPEPLLISHQPQKRFQELGILLPSRLPAALIAIPLPPNDSYTGALIIETFDPTNTGQFDEAHKELLSTAISQAATALENARLFEQMQEALRAIENRERYQGGVAQSAAHLSEFGLQALPDVLKYLGHAAQASRIYLLQYQVGDQTSTWNLVEDWTSPMVAYLFDRSKIHKIPFDVFAAQTNEVRANGWLELQASQDSSPAGVFLRSQNLHTSLILSVPAKGPMPNLLVFDQIDHERHWLNDEVNILRVASDAIANTYVREDLLNQLQANLEETESLYNATNRLVLAADTQEMIAAIISDVKSSGFNRAVMLIFETDLFAKLTRITVQGNWYSGFGTPPIPVQSEIPLELFGRILQTQSALFIENTATADLEAPLQQALLDQGVQSFAILPMWSSKKQLGAILIQSEQPHLFSERENRTLPPLVDQLTISVENMRLFEQTQTALAETALLYNISSAIAQAQTADDMVRLVIERVLPRGADKAALMAANLSETNEILDLEIIGFQDLHHGPNLKGSRIRLDEMPVVQMLTDEGLMIANTDSADAASRQTLERCGVHAVSFVPLRSGGRLIGILSASAHTPTHFDPADIRLLRTVGNGIAVALEKQRLLREAQRRALELRTASEIARDTTSTLSLDLLLNRIVNLLVQRLGYDHTSIYLIDDARNFVILREASGEIGAEIKRTGHRIIVGSRSVIGTVASTGEALVLNDITASPIYIAHPLLPDTHAEMALPLKIGSRITGVLDIKSNRANTFTNEDVNVLGILVDQISIAIENARAYELSQKAIEDMREVDRVKSQFLANMSHELRTPLNSIIGFSKVIMKGIDGPVSEMQQQDLTAIHSSGQHLLTLINDILDLSKIEAGKMELSFSEINLGDLVNSTMSTAVGLVKDKPIKLEKKIPPDLPNVRADVTRIRQVLINFLSNAAKFSEEGSITVEASQILDPTGNPEIIVTVTDSGPGIAESDQAKLFLPFSQVDDSPTRKTGGTGLGLSICRSLIELHNGRIGLLSSKVGSGSTFFFTLPLPIIEKSVSGPKTRPGGSRPVILSIDDDLQVISLYQRYLQPQGYTVLALNDPRVAVETAKNCRPIAITLDVMMPEMDGWNVMQALKNDPETRDIPIIICSLAQDEEKGFSLGATDYLVKPFMQDELLHVITRLNPAGSIHRILVIDDDLDDLRLTKKMLEDQPHLQVNLAQGGQNGLTAIRKERPDAIILDLMMPGMDGFELLAQMRLDPSLDSIPVIILSGADLTPAQHQQLAELGKELLSKSILREKELIHTIEQALSRIRPSELLTAS